MNPHTLKIKMVKIEIQTTKSIKVLIDKSLKEVYKKINKLENRIIDLEEQNKKLRFLSEVKG